MLLPGSPEQLPLRNKIVVKESSPESLQGLTRTIKDTTRKVDDHLHQGGVLSKLHERHPKLSPINGVTEPAGRYSELVRGIGRIVGEATGVNVDTLIYPCNGSEILSPILLVNQKPNQGPKIKLLTIDRDNMFTQYTPDSVPHSLYASLVRRLVRGFHRNGENNGLLDYAMDLSLLGVNPDSIQVIAQERDLNSTVVITLTRFTLPDGTEVENTNVAGYKLKERFDLNNPSDCLVASKLMGVISGERKTMLLRKGWAAGTKITGSFYSLMPVASVVLADEEPHDIPGGLIPENKIPELLNLPVRLESQRKLARGALETLQGFPSGSSPNPDIVKFGYCKDMTNLGIYLLKRAS